ncbi:MAG: AAA family ATPase, partial [Ilumatobacter sp.]|nr:AAA family ATPase [Ilumatobacter sp.]
DETGMVATGDLAHLTRLAERQQWRLVLVGDPFQLQAVGRGGMFAELAATSRTHPLTHIHRFTHQWEAAASLQLRHGDIEAINAYSSHGRIHPGPIQGQITAITERWMDATQHGKTVAVTASSNEHVDTLNAAIQAARVAVGHLGSDTVAIGGGEHARIRDTVVTRRNARELVTSAGERVRNR